MDDTDVWTMLWKDFALRLAGAALLGFAIGCAPWFHARAHEAASVVRARSARECTAPAREGETRGDVAPDPDAMLEAIVLACRRQAHGEPG